MYVENLYIYGMSSAKLLKGTLQTIILKLLEDHDKMYGYEITQKVKQLQSDFSAPLRFPRCWGMHHRDRGFPTASSSCWAIRD